jgi:hypothetical protein
VEPTYRLLKTSRISLLLEEGRGDLGVSEVTELLSSRSAWLELCKTVSKYLYFSVFSLNLGVLKPVFTHKTTLRMKSSKIIMSLDVQITVLWQTRSF